MEERISPFAQGGPDKSTRATTVSAVGAQGRRGMRGSRRRRRPAQERFGGAAVLSGSMPEKALGEESPKAMRTRSGLVACYQHEFFAETEDALRGSSTGRDRGGACGSGRGDTDNGSAFDAAVFRDAHARMPLTAQLLRLSDSDNGLGVRSRYGRKLLSAMELRYLA